ncbi:hypothetical protein AYL99_08648 [Fonsecaea erecta]|uniref:SWIM-type domain-containing protein n=1 Tax=Fonsecaea erecta TaxID=1367422 RepID=A0A178ZDL7_9EURO|nr:hypothetical protein AYL99_08648 [Fonsecaea erecta]OAP57910.1 hypothetical protein AYL99_08648 [Fonsecaea erecta]
MTLNQSQASILNSIIRALSQFLDPNTFYQDQQPSHLHDQPQHVHRKGVHPLSLSNQEKARPVFLTLHMLFPHELLPALDLLDRGLVTNVMVKHSATRQNDQEGMPGLRTSAGQDCPVLEHAEVQHLEQSGGNSCEVFYIQSSSAVDKQLSRSRIYPRGGHTSMVIPFYEVRLDSWNCTCPAFSISMFQSLNLQHNRDPGALESDLHIGRTSKSTGKIKGELEFGGIAVTKFAKVPSCKHLVAAFLAKAAPALFTDSVQKSTVSREEAVAWGAGWGEHRGT